MNSKYRNVILFMLFLAMLINYMDRAALSVAMPFITQNFHLDAAQKGMIFSSFFIGYAAFNFIGGYCADKFGAKRVFTWSMGFWSVFCGMTAAVTGFWSLLAARILFGMGEGPISTTANKVVNSWFPLKERARAIGFNQAGGPLGGALAGPVVGMLALYFGWRVAFLAIATIGLVWTLCWRKLATDKPQQHPRVSPEEALEIEGEAVALQDHRADTQQNSFPLLQVLRRPAVFIMAFSLFCCSYNQFFFLSWFPSYLIDVQHLSLAQMSFVTSIPWLVGTAGYVLSGVIIDYIYRLTGRQLFSRKVVLVTSLIGAAACIALTSTCTTVTGAVALMTVGVGLLMLASPAYWAIIQDCVPRSSVGSASGVMHGLGNTSGIIGPAATGFLIRASGNYQSAFLLAGGLAAIGAIVVALFISDSNERLAVPAYSR